VIWGRERSTQPADSEVFDAIWIIDRPYGFIYRRSFSKQIEFEEWIIFTDQSLAHTPSVARRRQLAQISSGISRICCMRSFYCSTSDTPGVADSLHCVVSLLCQCPLLGKPSSVYRIPFFALIFDPSHTPSVARRRRSERVESRSTLRSTPFVNATCTEIKLYAVTTADIERRRDPTAATKTYVAKLGDDPPVQSLAHTPSVARRRQSEQVKLVTTDILRNDLNNVFAIMRFMDCGYLSHFAAHLFWPLGRTLIKSIENDFTICRRKPVHISHVPSVARRRQ